MPDSRYDVVFYGEIVDGFDLEQVKANFVRLFATTEERVERLFRGRRVTLKPDLDESTAQHYLRELKRAGAHAKLEVTGAIAALANTAAQGGDAAAVTDDSGLRHYPFQFSGNGGEYFRIWIVNLLLSILTLGIYSAWAKVRNKRYFYGNTSLDGASFDYLANPVTILKGRLIAVGFFVLYSAAGNLVPLLGALLGLLMMVLLPWIIVRSLAFNAYNSAHRNIRFGFDAPVWEAFKAFVGWPILAVLTLGILAPMAFCKQQRFVVENHSYGQQQFSFHASTRDYVMLFLAVIGIGVAIAALSAVLGALSPALMMLWWGAGYLAIFAYFSVHSTNLLYNNSALGEHVFRAQLQLPSYARLYLVNTVATALTLGLFIPWAKVRTARYLAEHVSLLSTADLGAVAAAEQADVGVLGEEVGDVFGYEFGV